MVLLINVLVFSMKIHLFEIRIAILRAYDAEYPPYREKYRLVLCDRLVLCWSSFRFSDQRDQQVLSLSIAKLEMQKKAIFAKSLTFQNRYTASLYFRVILVNTNESIRKQGSSSEFYDSR